MKVLSPKKFATLGAILIFGPLPISAEETVRPAGWETMSAERKAEFEALASEIRKALDGMQLTDQQRAEMTEAECRAHGQLCKTITAGLHEKFADSGFELAEKVSVTELTQPGPEVANQGGGFAPPPGPPNNIVYDSGTVFGTAGLPSQMLGNRFDTRLGQPLPAGAKTITQVEFQMINTFFSSAVLSIYEGAAHSNPLQQVTSMGRGVMTGLNNLNVSAPTTANVVNGPSFLAGIWQFDPTMTALAVDTGTVNSQGFHAISLNDGAVGAGLTDVTNGGMGLNAVFRVTGGNNIPVELKKFDVTPGEDGSE